MANFADVSKRPGGLTTLAVLNFALAALSAVSYASLLALVGEDGATGGEPAARIASSTVYLVLVTGLVSCALLALAGIGYLERRRLLGRLTGNGYAILALVNSVLVMAALPEGFGLATVIGLVYPPVTLVLLNLRFKAEFA